MFINTILICILSVLAVLTVVSYIWMCIITSVLMSKSSIYNSRTLWFVVSFALTPVLPLVFVLTETVAFNRVIKNTVVSIPPKDNTTKEKTTKPKSPNPTNTTKGSTKVKVKPEETKVSVKNTNPTNEKKKGNVKKMNEGSTKGDRIREPNSKKGSRLNNTNDFPKKERVVEVTDAVIGGVDVSSLPKTTYNISDN